jgi:NAD(P) transhydrogenase subunit alpha
MYGKNILNFLKLIIDKDGNLNLNFEDELVKETCIAHGGKVTNERVAALLS